MNWIALNRGSTEFFNRINLLTQNSVSEVTTFRRRHSQKDFVYSNLTGIFEPFVDLGDAVEVNQVAGRIHFTDDPWREPVELRFKKSGIVILKRPLARTHNGECVFGTGDILENMPLK